MTSAVLADGGVGVEKTHGFDINSPQSGEFTEFTACIFVTTGSIDDNPRISGITPGSVDA
jgi:hypothetical protein